MTDEELVAEVEDLLIGVTADGIVEDVGFGRAADGTLLAEEYGEDGTVVQTRRVVITLGESL